MLTTINFIDAVGLGLKLSLKHPAVLQDCRGITTASSAFQMLKYLGTRVMGTFVPSPSSSLPEKSHSQRGPLESIGKARQKSPKKTPKQTNQPTPKTQTPKPFQF